MSNSAVIPFDFNGQMVRVVEQGGQPWWVATDVAKILGYRNAPDMVRNLDEEEKASHSVGPATHNVRSRGGSATQNSGGEQAREVTIISESGVFHAILKSRKPAAREFRRWVTGELLPSLRRDGHYAITPPPKSTVAQIEHSDRTARRRELPGLLDRYEGETNPEKRRILYALIVRACESEGIEPPAHDAIGYSTPLLTDTLAAFWEHVAALEAKGDLINYHRNPNKLAFRRKQLEEAFRRNGIDVKIDSALLQALKRSKSPLFEAVTGVSTTLEDRKTVYAWVFDRTIQ